MDMPRAHTYLQNITPYIFTLSHGQGSWTLQEKGESHKPAHGPPLQARVAAANGTVLQLANMLGLTILAHMDMNGGKQSKMNGGKMLRRAVGMTWQRVDTAGKHSLQNQAAAGNTAGGLSTRHRPQTNSQQLAGLAAKTTAVQ